MFCQEDHLEPFNNNFTCTILQIMVNLAAGHLTERYKETGLKKLIMILLLSFIIFNNVITSCRYHLTHTFEKKFRFSPKPDWIHSINLSKEFTSLLYERTFLHSEVITALFQN